MTSVLYDKQHKQSSGLVLEPDAFKSMLEDADPELNGFFEEMCDIILPENWSPLMRQENKKKVITILYLIAGIRNMHVNQFKLEVGLYLAAAGTPCEAIDTLSNAGISVTYKTVYNNKNKIAKQHSSRVDKYFIENVGICIVLSYNAITHQMLCF
jgi:hypothetical protein